MSGFALPEYITPNTAVIMPVLGGTMPKDTKATGATFQQVEKHAAKVPAPDHYCKDLMDHNFARKANGGGFSKLNRSYIKTNGKTPAVGQYESTSAQTSPKIIHGVMAKKERGCLFWDAAVRHSKDTQTPGRYDALRSDAPHVTTPGFTTGTSVSRSPRKPLAAGPGYYNPNMTAIEESTPSWSANKDGISRTKDGRPFMDIGLKNKSIVPAPGHKGIPDTKLMDRHGLRKHADHILNDRFAGMSPR